MVDKHPHQVAMVDSLHRRELMGNPHHNKVLMDNIHRVLMDSLLVMDNPLPREPMGNLLHRAMLVSRHLREPMDNLHVSARRKTVHFRSTLYNFPLLVPIFCNL